LLTDPYEVNNLAGSRDHQQILSRMRTALEKRIKETGDLGSLDEDDLIERIWPGRKQPVAARPTFSAISTPDSSISVTIRCATEGACIGYKNAEQPP
jgi:hypothetical protein